MNQSPQTKAAREWDAAHAPTARADGVHKTVPSRLFTDENPATTIKGTGFKNAKIARRTIELTSQPFAKYKQYWTIRAMRERAANHPHPTDGIRDAIEIFDKWLDNYKEEDSTEKKSQFKKWNEYKKLCNSNNANKHCYGSNPTKEELKRARDDIYQGQKLLVDLITRRRSDSPPAIKFPIASFIAIFGGGGSHGYGKHDIIIDQMQSTSNVEILGLDGLQELIGSTKATKLGLLKAAKIHVQYNRESENAIVVVEQNESIPTLTSLWNNVSMKRDAAKTIDTRIRSESDKFRGSKIRIVSKCNKRRKLGCDEHLIAHDDSGPSWTCSSCTFIHMGNAKIDFLVCELCGSQRESRE